MVAAMHANLDANTIEVIASSLVNLKGIVLKAKHVAEAALFLVLDESVYVSGHNLTLTGVFV